MPIYEYKCPKGHVFELFQKMSDEPPKVCETCGEGPLQRVLYPIAVHFKGSGFYSTDYGKGGAARKPSSDGEKPEKSSDSSSEKGDKKKDVKKVTES